MAEKQLIWEAVCFAAASLSLLSALDVYRGHRQTGRQAATAHLFISSLTCVGLEHIYCLVLFIFNKRSNVFIFSL